MRKRKIRTTAIFIATSTSDYSPALFSLLVASYRGLFTEKTLSLSAISTISKTSWTIHLSITTINCSWKLPSIATISRCLSCSGSKRNITFKEAPSSILNLWGWHVITLTGICSSTWSKLKITREELATNSILQFYCRMLSKNLTRKSKAIKFYWSLSSCTRKQLIRKSWSIYLKNIIRKYSGRWAQLCLRYTQMMSSSLTFRCMRVRYPQPLSFLPWRAKMKNFSSKWSRREETFLSTGKEAIHANSPTEAPKSVEKWSGGDKNSWSKNIGMNTVIFQKIRPLKDTTTVFPKKSRTTQRFWPRKMMSLSNLNLWLAIAIQQLFLPAQEEERPNSRSLANVWCKTRFFPFYF